MTIAEIAISEHHATSDLVATLEHLDVYFVRADADSRIAQLLLPDELISGLAYNADARIRLALIPLFLRRPLYAAHVPNARRGLAEPQDQTLCFFYTAARLLQQKYCAELADIFGDSVTLPDLFKQTLGLDNNICPDKRLRQLAEHQAKLTKRPLNWYGTYEHAYTRLVRHTKLRQKWLS